MCSSDLASGIRLAGVTPWAFSVAQAQAKQNQALSMIMKPALRGFLFVREYDNIPRIVTHIGQNYGIPKN